jgi:hypothetical protein
MLFLKKVIVSMDTDVTLFIGNKFKLMKKLNGKRFILIIDKLSRILTKALRASYSNYCFEINQISKKK